MTALAFYAGCLMGCLVAVALMALLRMAGDEGPEGSRGNVAPAPSPGEEPPRAAVLPKIENRSKT